MTCERKRDRAPLVMGLRPFIFRLSASVWNSSTTSSASKAVSLRSLSHLYRVLSSVALSASSCKAHTVSNRLLSFLMSSLTPQSSPSSCQAAEANLQIRRSITGVTISGNAIAHFLKLLISLLQLFLVRQHCFLDLYNTIFFFLQQPKWEDMSG